MFFLNLFKTLKMKELIVSLFTQKFDRNYIRSIKEFDLEIVTETVLDNYEYPDLNDFIFEALSRYKDIVINRLKYNDLNDLLNSITDWDDFIQIYVNGLNSSIDFNENDFINEHDVKDEDLLYLVSELYHELTDFKK